MITEFNIAVFWNEERKKVQFRLLKDYRFVIDNSIIRVPAGYITDFASTPRWSWSLFPQLGKHNPAALVHDWLYDTKTGTRRKADFIFLLLMLQYKVSIVQALIMWAAVRMFGKKRWIDNPRLFKVERYKHYFIVIAI